jgi:hypothetical protein
MKTKLERLRWIGLIAVVALAIVPLGCATIMKDAAKGAAPGVISGVAEGLADPNNQRLLLESVDEGRVKTMSARLSAGFMDGVLATLEDPTRRRRLDTILNGLTTMVAGTAVDSVFGHVLDEKVQARLRLAMRENATDLMGAVFDTVDSRVGTSDERTAAISKVVHEIAKQATLGFQDALDETRRDRISGAMPKADGALVIGANDASRTGSRILWTLGIGLGSIVLGLAITLVVIGRKNRLTRSELAERDDALSLLTEAIKTTATRPGADELYSALKSSMGNRAGGERIRKALGELGQNLVDKAAQMNPAAAPLPSPHMNGRRERLRARREHPRESRKTPA